MAIGVLIVLIYIWSGESLVALVFSVITLFAVAAIVEWKPWAVDPGTELFGALRQPPGKATHASSRNGAAKGPGSGAAESRPVWRSRFDITWDTRGVSGVAVGKVAPQLWSWSQIDDISQAWVEDESPVSHGDSADTDTGNGTGTNTDSQQQPKERVALCLDFPSLRNPEEPEQAPVMFGPSQDPEQVVVGLRSAWRESKITQSRFHDLSPAERTQIFAEHLGYPAEAMRTLNSQSPTLLYQGLRKALLAGGELCRISSDADLDEVLDRFDGLLEANEVDPLSRSEAEELQAADQPGGRDRMAALHWTLDWVAEQRGLRLAFIDQLGPGSPEVQSSADDQQRDYLVGLIPAQSADDWDGQTIGSGSTRVLLDPP